MEALIEELKVDIKEQLNLEDIETDEMDADELLFGETFGLDSIDALELIVLLEKKYGIKVESPEAGKKIFHTIRTIAEYIQSKQSA